MTAQNTQQQQTHAAADGQLVFNVDPFSAVLHNDRKAVSSKLARSNAALERVVVDNAKTRMNLSAPVNGTPEQWQAYSQKMALVKTVAADKVDGLSSEVFTRLYRKDVERYDVAATGTQTIQTLHDTLTDLPEFQRLQSTVTGDPDLAALATADMLNALAQPLADMLQQLADSSDKPQEGKGNGKGSAGPSAEDMLRAAARQACTAAADSAEESRDQLEGLAAGTGATPLPDQHRNTSRTELAEVLSTDPRIQKVLELAGRLTRLNQQAKKQATPDGFESLVGFEYGNDLARLTPLQRSKMAHPVLKKAAMIDFFNAELQQFKFNGLETVGRGNVCVLLDRSGSMSYGDGLADILGIAATLATLNACAAEKRICNVIGFNHGVQYSVQLDRNGASWHLDYKGLKGRKIGSQVDLALFILRKAACGGTDFDAPLTSALTMQEGLQGNKRSDLLLITDGFAAVSDRVAADLAEWKQNEDGKFFTVLVNGGRTDAQITDLSDSLVDLSAEVRSSDSVDNVIGSAAQKKVSCVLP